MNSRASDYEHISSGRIASTAVLTRFQFVVFRNGIVITANLAEYNKKLISFPTFHKKKAKSKF